MYTYILVVLTLGSVLTCKVVGVIILKLTDTCRCNTEVCVIDSQWLVAARGCWRSVPASHII